MTAEELVRRFEAGDLYGLMLLATRAWLERDHPDADRAGLYAFFGDDQLPIRVRIPVSVASRAGGPSDVAD